LKVALVHEWLTNLAGSEKVLLALRELYQEAPIYTSVYDANRMKTFADTDVHTSFLQKFPGAIKHYQKYLPLMPLAFESFALEGYDVVISSSHACAKGIITRPGTLHICYCHTPMRYAWDFYQHYLTHETGKLSRPFVAPLLSYLRLWDVASANRVDYFIANSQIVARRIGKHYRREAVVIHPPVDVDRFTVAPAHDEFFLTVGRLVSYKRVDLAVQACTKLNLPLVVIGDGPERKRLEAMAGPSVQFLGYQSDEVIRDHYARCRAFLFPGEEDFGITVVEAQAAGRPVIAYGKGGVLDSVVPGRTGLFFTEQTSESLCQAITDLRDMPIDPQGIRAHAQKFSRPRFIQEIKEFVDSCVQRL
jgi:glycosyltransferase involved in cell wall biosynthesis